MIAVYLATIAMLLFTQDIAIGQNSDDENTATAPIKYGVWENADDPDSHGSMQMMRLKVHPQAAPVPALKHRLIPDPADRTEGNSAMFYLQAMGFNEQFNARKQLHEMQQKWGQEARDSEGITDGFPPNIWFDMPTSELPLDDVKAYLDLIAFQEHFLYDAARRKNYSQDRAMEKEANPIAYTLPEVQQMRELARQQIVRLRYAVAQQRIDDAVEILGQMIAMANHVGEDQFFVSSLVAVAIEGIAVQQGFFFSQQADAPNLYWAIAACPDPLIDLSSSIEFERNFLLRQFPILAEVDETARSDRYWTDFVDEISPQWNELAKQMNSWGGGGNFPENVDRFQMASNIGTHYESARDFLSEVSNMPNQQLDKYSTTQTVFLAIVKHHAIVMDDATVEFYLPQWSPQRSEVEANHKRWRNELGWIAEVSEVFLPATKQIRLALTRAKQWLSLWQIVEAIRMTASESDGTMPLSLDELSVPAPLDPVTGRPFSYVANGQTTTITGQRVGGSRYQLVVEMVKSKTEESK